jgi:hypothetical protein
MYCSKHIECAVGLLAVCAQVDSEPYDWRPGTGDARHTAVLHKLPSKNALSSAKKMRANQFPQRCADHKILAAKDSGRFWGSMANAWTPTLSIAITGGAIVAPFFYGEVWMVRGWDVRAYITTLVI